MPKSELFKLPSSFPTERPKVVLLLGFFICAPVVSYVVFVLSITKTHLLKYIEHFTAKKGKFSEKKKSDIFHISAQT